MGTINIIKAFVTKVGSLCNASVCLFICHLLLSVQCYAWTEYKFTCVCLSVCPSHFLSTRLQVRPLDGFFTVDSLDADLRKGVPFGGLDDE